MSWYFQICQKDQEIHVLLLCHHIFFVQAVYQELLQIQLACSVAASTFNQLDQYASNLVTGPTVTKHSFTSSGRNHSQYSLFFLLMEDGWAKLAWVAGYISMWYAHLKTSTITVLLFCECCSRQVLNGLDVEQLH